MWWAAQHSTATEESTRYNLWVCARARVTGPWRERNEQLGQKNVSSWNFTLFNDAHGMSLGCWRLRRMAHQCRSSSASVCARDGPTETQTIINKFHITYPTCESVDALALTTVQNWVMPQEAWVRSRNARRLRCLSLSLSLSTSRSRYGGNGDNELGSFFSQRAPNAESEDESKSIIVCV